MQDELGLNVYDLGARGYMPDLGRMMTIDPKAEQYLNQSSYVLSINNPVFFVDINGEGVETDYKVLKADAGKDEGKIVRADPNDGSENDATDRIVKTDKHDAVIKDSGGKAKSLIDNIKKGIVTEGMNMRTDNQIIKVGGVDQPSSSDVEKFLVAFSREILGGTEISGFGGFSPSDEKQNLMMVDPYKDNSYLHSYSPALGMYELKETLNGSIYLTSHFHTHDYKNGYEYENGLDNPSDDDSNAYQTRKDIFKISMPHYILSVNGKKEYKK